jgi:chemotaxis protein CheC
MSSQTVLSREELGHLTDVVALGFENSARGLSGMVGKEIKVISPLVRLAPIEEIPKLIGRPEELVVALYLGVSGDVEGHILIIFSLEAAGELVEMLLGEAPSNPSDLGEMERSALGEVANVTGSFFLSALGDATNLAIQPSPPGVMMDMAGAALDVPLISLAVSTEEVLIIDTWFVDQDREINGLFLMLPDAESLHVIVERLSQIYG